MASFSEGAMKGFALMDAYYDRQDAREARKEEKQHRDRLMTMREAEHKSSLETADIQQQAARQQLDETAMTTLGKEWSYHTTDDNGDPIDPSKLSPEELKAKQKWLSGFMNRLPEARKFALLNPDVNPDQPYATPNFVFDKQAGQPAAVINLNMKDGSVKPMTRNRSADPNDQIIVPTFGQLYSRLSSALGPYAGLKMTPEERRAIKAKQAEQGFELKKMGVQHGYDMEKTLLSQTADLAKEGLTLKKGADGYSLESLDGGGKRGGLMGKRLDDQLKILMDENKKVYGSEGMSGMVSLDGTGQQYTWANLMGEHYLNNGMAKSGIEAGAMSRQAADELQANGGSIKWDEQTGAWYMATGKTDASGNPEVVPLAAKIGGATGVAATGTGSKPSPAGESIRPLTLDALPAGVTKENIDAIPAGKKAKVAGRIIGKDENGKVYDLGAASATTGESKPTPALAAADKAPVKAASKPAGGQGPARAIDANRAVALMEEQRRNRKVTTKEHLAAAKYGLEAAERVERARSRGVEQQMSIDDLELAIASGKLSAATEASARKLVAQAQ